MCIIVECAHTACVKLVSPKQHTHTLNFHMSSTMAAERVICFMGKKGDL